MRRQLTYRVSNTLKTKQSQRQNREGQNGRTYHHKVLKFAVVYFFENQEHSRISLKHPHPVLFVFKYSSFWASQVVLVVKNPPANTGDIRAMGQIPGSGRSPGGGHGNSLQYFCLENPHGQKSLAGHSPQSHKESDMTEATQHTQICEDSVVVDIKFSMNGK